MSGSGSKWGAMDLHGAPGGAARFQQQQFAGYNARSAAAAAGASGASSGASGMKVDDSGLSARNILIRRKLMERKRFDSADHAMKTSKEPAAATTDGSHSKATDEQPRHPVPQQKMFYTTTSSNHLQNQLTAAFSPAKVGASVLYNALGGGSGDDDENIDMDAKADPATATAKSVAASSSSSYLAQSTAAAARGASRYGSLSGPPGGAASARSILLQKKLREKKHFDSADYQLAQLKPHAAANAGASPSSSASNSLPADGGDVISTTDDDASGASPMEIDPTPVINPAVASINSPSAASVAVRSRMSAQMSPSVRGGKYGSAQSGANVLLMRKLSEKKRFDSADYHMEVGPAARAAASKQQHAAMGETQGATQSFFVTATAPVASLPTPPPVTGAAAAPAPAPQALSTASTGGGGGGGGSKYGKLSAVNVLIRKKLKERKRFDSADYAMEKQGRRLPPGGAQGGSAGALRGGHVVADTPMTLNVTMADAEPVSSSPPSDENKSISHQVKHIKLSEGGGGWAAARVPAAASESASPARASAAAKAGTSSMSQDNRLVARNLIIQRKLSERKRFDSADYFKEAANRNSR